MNKSEIICRARCEGLVCMVDIWACVLSNGLCRTSLLLSTFALRSSKVPLTGMYAGAVDVSWITPTVCDNMILIWSEIILVLHTNRLSQIQLQVIPFHQETLGFQCFYFHSESPPWIYCYNNNVKVLLCLTGFLPASHSSSRASVSKSNVCFNFCLCGGDPKLILNLCAVIKDKGTWTCCVSCWLSPETRGT